MDLPPPTYGLLLGPTLLLLPFVVRWARRTGRHRQARSILLALALLELALITLHYSKLACWVLAGLSSVWLATVAHPAGRRSAALATGTIALAAGLLFQFLPGEGGFLAYFAVGLPLMFGLPLVLLAASWLRWDARPATVLAAIGLLAFAGTFAAAAFGQDFLRLFEVTHLGATLASILALAWLVGPSTAIANQRRMQPLCAMDPGEYAAREPPPTRHLVPTVLVSALAAAAGIALLLLDGPADPRITLAAAVLAGLGLAALPIVRSSAVALAGATAGLVANLLVPIAPTFDQYLAAGPARSLPYLLIAAAGATASLLAIATAWAVWLDRHRRTTVLQDKPRVPATFLQYVLGRLPNPQDLGSFAGDVRRHRAPGGVLTVDPARPDPLQTLSDAAYAWLADQDPSQARVHVALIEDGQTYHVPPIAPEERDA